ncbi:MAG: hypothetical protein WDA72_09815 [Desulfomonilia bacterium]|jgi:hypothetical protein|nr:hypothetical protein [Deltaproteobacteria bacterium]MDX9760489.1 hypothetical protein [Desulfomonilia bacterium]HPW68867.1 hypothetical protein [Deltaproteobacteria bacterium]
MEYVHPVLNEEITAIAGHYTLISQEILPHEKGGILYFVGYAHMDTSCCGLKGCGYAVVAGHVAGLCSSRTPDGRPVSQVVPVDEALHQEVSRVIRERYGVSQVHFVLASGGKRVVY